ncbi:PREDICTED: uncharacterized protein LOC109114113 [Nelumbo nucifera]|uniref:Uncharacterized protein LOC109114113 n=1 Tax=Nelumbo nucifera TaxID=4432 RepID=A0A1U8PZ24_NELNU|nr:PREDICTED: uncharacterized protein LOC109114113 [Nelumbo nucifera]
MVTIWLLYLSQSLNKILFFILYIFGLGPEYESIITVITNRPNFETLTINDILGLLLNHEAWLEQHKQPIYENSPLANLVENFNNNRSKNSWNQKPFNGHGGFPQTHGCGHGGRGRNGNPNPSNTSSGRGNGGDRGKGGTPSIVCQVCSKPGHGILTCRSHYDLSYREEQQLNSTEPAAYHTGMSSEFNPTWYPNSGATHHLTQDLENLQNKSEYSGPNQVTIGNETSLRFLSIGSSSLQYTHHSFALHNIYHVPHITKNLLSVSQFTKDNEHFFEFHRDCFLLKDYTRRVLFEELVEMGYINFLVLLKSRIKLQCLLENVQPFWDGTNDWDMQPSKL